MSTDHQIEMVAKAEMEKQIAIICRGLADCIERLPYKTLRKAEIYLRISEAMAQAGQSELINTVVEVQNNPTSLFPPPPATSNS